MKSLIFTLAWIAIFFTSVFSQNLRDDERRVLLDRLNNDFRGAIDALDSTYQMIRNEIYEAEKNILEQSDFSELGEALTKMEFNWDVVLRIVGVIQDSVKVLVEKFFNKKF